MGILEFVNNEHAGLIPRATSQSFEYISRESRADINVSLSFLQLYRETIQDLLSPANTAGSSSSNPNSGANTPAAEENLPIREDPIRGFYVEGLQEFTVRSYGEAEALINLGLENRAIAPTLMNATSSRSHIVLTINTEENESYSLFFLL
jgi:kinesin family protein 5